MTLGWAGVTLGWAGVTLGWTGVTLGCASRLSAGVMMAGRG